MEILPSDLGQWRTVTLLRLRATMTSTQQTSGYTNTATQAANRAVVTSAAPAYSGMSAQKQKPMGFWTRFWVGGSGLEGDAARQAVRGMGGLIGGFVGGFGVWGFIFFAVGAAVASSGDDLVLGLIFAVLGAVMSATGVILPRELMTKYIRKPLSVRELETLRDASEDPTEKAFLNVVAEVLRQPLAAGEPAHQDVRAAIQTLGEAIDKLPRVTAPHQSADELQAEAQKAWGEADREPDTIIAASLRRRAEAQEKTAQAAQKSALLLRRSTALRCEIEAQIEALRMGLSGFDVGSTDVAQNHAAAQNAAAHLSQLAASVQSVAREAGSLHDARDEVAAWMDETTPAATSALPMYHTKTSSDVPAEVVTLGRGPAR